MVCGVRNTRVKKDPCSGRVVCVDVSSLGSPKVIDERRLCSASLGQSRGQSSTSEFVSHEFPRQNASDNSKPLSSETLRTQE